MFEPAPTPQSWDAMARDLLPDGWHADAARCRCRTHSWVYEPDLHGPWDFTGHHPACPQREGEEDE